MSERQHRFELVTYVGSYALMKLLSSGMLYACWYDAGSRQTRRRSLQTTDVSLAVTNLQNAVDRGATGDPKQFLAATPVSTVNDVLDSHVAYVKTLASAEAEQIQIRRLRRLLGERRLASLVRRDFEAFRDKCLAEGLSIATISRTLGTLRSADQHAVDDRRLRADAAPRVPEFRTKNHVRSSPPKGRIMTVAEVGRLVDAAKELHLQVFLAFLLNTAARVGAILDLTSSQIDRENGLIDLNPPGRVQTKKYRPVLPITSTLRPWVENLPEGRLITWRGEAIAEIDTAWMSACRRAGLAGGANTYSIRHSIARFMRKNGVSGEEIAVWLGHIQPPESPATTLLYSPYSPTYLDSAREVVAAYVKEVAAAAKRNILEPPWASR